jgi:uncharacterized membrane protein (UPF0127 family)
MLVKVNDKTYHCKVARTEQEKEAGLQGLQKLPHDEGMLFVYDEPQTVSFWMKDTLIPLDVVFINDEEEVIAVYEGAPESEEAMQESGVSYVLEVNAGSGIEEGDGVDIEQDPDELPHSKMLVLDEDGNVQLELDGGERIVSRKETVVLIKKAKRAYAAKGTAKYESLCADLGNFMFKVLDKQDKNKPEYVELKDED